MWGLSPSDNNSQINNYKAQYGVGNPCAGTEGGGPQAINVVNSGQPFIGYPTYVVVCPDHTVHYDVCWPPTVNCFDPYFEECGATGIMAMFEADIEELCAGGEVSFTDLSTPGITSWEWTFEGGTPENSNEQNPVVMYEMTGTFDVSLTVSDGSNSASIYNEEMIMIHALPEVSLESFGEVCIEWEPFELTGGLPEGGEYSGPGVMDGIFDPLAVGLGNYVLTYTYIDDQDCENFAEAEIIVTSCVGIDETEPSGIRIYPNPSDGIFTVSPMSDETLFVEVLNSAGQIIHKAIINNSEIINLTDKVNGIYYLRIKSTETNQIVKLILMKE